MDIAILVSAAALDLILGDPHGWPHPIIYIGKLISSMEKNIRKSGISLLLGGFMLSIGTIAMVEGVLTLLLFTTGRISPYLQTSLTVYLVYVALSSKCLAIETKKVYTALRENDLKKARKELSFLVGRDTSGLGANEIIRADVETIAENTIDGIVAPLFFLIIGFIIGIPAQMIFLYKTINTLDSMVGYVQEPYREIGFASAKIDDMANYLPSRIGGLIMLVGGGLLGYDWKNGIGVLRRDCRNHKSPNCGYPESAVAGLLGIRIGGCNTYFGQTVYKPTIGDELNELKAEHIIHTIKIMYSSMALSVMIGCLTIYSISGV